MSNSPEIFKTEEWEYSIANDTVTIIKYIGKNSNVTIPDEIEDKKGCQNRKRSIL